MIIKCLTDNKNRTLTDVRTVVTRCGGQFTDINNIAWQFDNKGVIKVNQDNLKGKDSEQIEMTIIEAGADDYFEDDEELTIYTRPEELQDVKEGLEQNGIKVDSADLEMIAKDKKDPDSDTLDKVTKVLAALDEIDEVSDYYSNLN